jgi:hypothetical protein
MIAKGARTLSANNQEMMKNVAQQNHSDFGTNVLKMTKKDSRETFH